MTDSKNIGNYSRLSSDPTLGGMVDGVDFPHTGVFKALAVAAQGNFAILNAATTSTTENFSIVQTDLGADNAPNAANKLTRFVVGSGMVMRDGKAILVPANSGTTTFNTGTPVHFNPPTSVGNGYFLLVVAANNTLAIKDNGNRTTLNTVPQLTAGDIPIAMIRLAYGESGATRLIQYFTTAKSENSVSIGYNASTVYTETMSVIGDVDRTTFKNKIANADIRFVLADNTAAEKFEVLTDDDSDGDEGDTTRFSVDGLGAVNIPALTASNIVISDGSKNLVSAAVGTYPSLAELAYVKGATSAIQTQLDAKAVRTGDQTLTGSILIDKDRAGSVGAETSKALHVDFDRLEQSSGTAAHDDIGIDLDVTSSSKGTSTAIGMDIDVVGAGDGTQVVKGLTVDVSGGNTNYSALFNGGFVGIGTTAPLAPLHVVNADNLPQIILESTDTDANVGPELLLRRNTGVNGAADNDLIGKINWQAMNIVDGQTTTAITDYANILATLLDITDGTEDSSLTFNTMLAGSLVNRMDLTATEAVFNEAGSDIDFRVESSSNVNMLYVDAGTHGVGIGTIPAATTALDVVGNVKIVSPNNASAVQTALNIDNLDTNSQAVHIEASNITANVLDITADTLTTHHGINITADSLTTGSALNIISDSDSTGIRNIAYIKNDHASSVNATTLKLESDTATEASAPVLHVKSASAGGSILLESTTDSADAGPEMHFYRNAGAGTASDDLGALKFYGQDNGDNKHLFAHIFADMHSVTNGSEAGRMMIQTFTGTNANNNIQIEQGQVVVNGSGGDINFRHRGNNDDYLIMSDSGLDRIGIGTGTPANKLQISHTGADGANGIMIVREDASTADGDLLGGIGFDSTDGNVPSSVLESSAFIASLATQDHTGNDKGGNLKFGVSLIDENEDVVSTVLASVGPPDTIANAACHAGFNSRATTAIVAAATYAPTITDSGTLVIFEHANSNLTLPSINNTTSVGVQFTVFNETGSAINAQIAVSNSATVNGGAIAALDDIASFKAATFVCSGNNTWIRIG